MYETNLRLPRLRMEAVRMVREGYGIREAARHFGYSPGAVSKWVVRANNLSSNARVIPTRSSTEKWWYRIHFGFYRSVALTFVELADSTIFLSGDNPVCWK